jgi:hypothetical protein
VLLSTDRSGAEVDQRRRQVLGALKLVPHGLSVPERDDAVRVRRPQAASDEIRCGRTIALPLLDELRQLLLVAGR